MYFNALPGLRTARIRGYMGHMAQLLAMSHEECCKGSISPWASKRHVQVITSQVFESKHPVSAGMDLNDP